MSHTSKFPPLKYTTATLPTDLPVGTTALDTTTNEHKSFNGSSWDVIEGSEDIGTPTIVFDSPSSYDQIQGDIPENWKKTDSSLKGLVIGTSCTSIGRGAFAYCIGLTGSLVIPDSVTSIGVYAFHDCYGFTGDLVIPNSVTSIGVYAFDSCSGFTGDLVIPNSVTSINSYAFVGCSGLTNVDCYVEKSVLDVGTQSLFGTSVTTIHVRSTDGTWTAGAGQTIGGKTGITVIKDL